MPIRKPHKEHWPQSRYHQNHSVLQSEFYHFKMQRSIQSRSWYEHWSTVDLPSVMHVYSQTHTGHRCILIAKWGIHGPSCLLPGLHWTRLQVQRWPPASVLAAGWRQPRRSEKIMSLGVGEYVHAYSARHVFVTIMFHSKSVYSSCMHVCVSRVIRV